MHSVKLYSWRLGNCWKCYTVTSMEMEAIRRYEMFDRIICITCGNSGNVPDFMEVHTCQDDYCSKCSGMHPFNRDCYTVTSEEVEMDKKTIRTDSMFLVYESSDGNMYTQTYTDLEDSGTLIDPETGDDMPIIGWTLQDLTT